VHLPHSQQAHRKKEAVDIVKILLQYGATAQVADKEVSGLLIDSLSSLDKR
jgi:hypothetical protein